jgi:hypothetical protein
MRRKNGLASPFLVSRGARTPAAPHSPADIACTRSASLSPAGPEAMSGRAARSRTGRGRGPGPSARRRGQLRGHRRPDDAPARLVTARRDRRRGHGLRRRARRGCRRLRGRGPGRLVLPLRQPASILLSYPTVADHVYDREHLFARSREVFDLITRGPAHFEDRRPLRLRRGRAGPTATSPCAAPPASSYSCPVSRPTPAEKPPERVLPQVAARRRSPIPWSSAALR